MLGDHALNVGGPRIYELNRAVPGACTELAAGRSAQEVNDQSVAEFGFFEERRSCNVAQRA